MSCVFLQLKILSLARRTLSVTIKHAFHIEIIMDQAYSATSSGSFPIIFATTGVKRTVGGNLIGLAAL